MTNNHININHNRSIINHHHHHLLPPSRSNSSTITTTRSSSSTITTARSNSTTQACAACRYQRRKCAPDCILAPYFPHDRQRQFQNAHKLFGVSNITKIIRDLDPQQKDEAMRTIIYQADVRAHDPVGGCFRIIRELQRQIEFSRAELEVVFHQLAFCRTHAAHAQNQHQNQNINLNLNHHHHNNNNNNNNNNLNQHDQILIEGVDCDIHLVNNPEDVNLYDHGLDLDLGQMAQEQDGEEHGGQYILGGQNEEEGCEDNQGVQIQEMNSWAEMNNSQPPEICLEVKAGADECEEFKPLMINEIPTGERHEFKFEFDDINEPSEEALFNDGNDKALSKEDNLTFFTKDENVSYQQHNEDNDLKGAATLFTLTNCSSY